MILIIYCLCIEFSVFLFHTIGCPNGFYGVKCRDQCRYPNYGEQCQSLCACESQLCNHISGCNFFTGKSDYNITIIT